MPLRPKSPPADSGVALSPSHEAGLISRLPLCARLVFLLALALCTGTGCAKDSRLRAKEPRPSWTCDSRADEPMRRSDYRESIVRHERFVKNNPGDALALYHLGYAYGQTGDHGKEALYYQKALDLGYKNDQIYFNLGMAYGELQEAERAIAAFRRAIKINPRSADSYFGLALVHQRIERDHASAEKALQKAIRIEPGFVDARLHLSLLYVDTGRPGKAREHLKRILEIDPGHGVARDLLEKIGKE